MLEMIWRWVPGRWTQLLSNLLSSPHGQEIIELVEQSAEAEALQLDLPFAPPDIDPDEPTIWLFFQTVDGQQIDVHVPDRFTITDLRMVVKDKTGLRMQDMRLIFRGKEIGGDINERNQTLRDLGIPDESTIHMVMQLRGGACHQCGSTLCVLHPDLLDLVHDNFDEFYSMQAKES